MFSSGFYYISLVRSKGGKIEGKLSNQGLQNHSSSFQPLSPCFHLFWFSSPLAGYLETNINSPFTFFLLFFFSSFLFIYEKSIQCQNYYCFLVDEISTLEFDPTRANFLRRSDNKRVPLLQPSPCNVWLLKNR